MSLPGSPSLEIERSTRAQYTVVGGVLAILTLVPWWLPRLSVAMAAVVALAAGTLASYSFWRIGWLGGGRVIHKASWSGSGEWRLFDRAGASWPATLVPSSQLLGMLLWLRFDSERGAREMLLLRYDLPSDTRRRLVTRLRLQAMGPKAESGDIADGKDSSP